MVSVIIPVFNAEMYLDECIGSILKQTYDDIEIILVDDGSTDSSGAICNWYAAKYDNICAIHEENKGQDMARKKGLDVAVGEFVLFIDADDWIDAKMIDCMMQKFADDIDIVAVGLRRVYENIIVDERENFSSGLYVGRDIAVNLIEKNRFFKYRMDIGICTKIFRKKLAESVFNKIDLYVTYSEDYMIFLIAFLNSNHVYFINEPFYYYRLHSESYIHRNNKVEAIVHKRLYCSLIREIYGNFKQKELLEQLDLAIIHILLLWSYDYFNDFEGIYPFVEGNTECKNIVIYGAGIFGQELYFNLKERNKKVVCILDRQWKEYSDNKELAVISLDTIKFSNNDIVLIAIMDPNARNEVYDELVKVGIKKEAIYGISLEIINSRYTAKALMRLRSE